MRKAVSFAVTRFINLRSKKLSRAGTGKRRQLRRKKQKNKSTRSLFTIIPKFLNSRKTGRRLGRVKEVRAHEFHSLGRAPIRCLTQRSFTTKKTSISAFLSGAHMNPAVTLAFAVVRRLDWIKVPVYWIAQLLGAFIASAVVYGIYHGRSSSSYLNNNNNLLIIIYFLLGAN